MHSKRAYGYLDKESGNLKLRLSGWEYGWWITKDTVRHPSGIQQWGWPHEDTSTYPRVTNLWLRLSLKDLRWLE